MKNTLDYIKNFIKERTKDKFILTIIFVIISIIGVQWYLSDGDRNSYVVLVDGAAQINEKSLEINTPVELNIEDRIQTIGQNSIAVIEWGDGSITRLGGNFNAVINELFVEKDLSQINLSFSLESGKSWSNVVSFLGEESSFEQNFQDVQASVRGTVFEVDLEKEYVFVEDHEVVLKKGETEVTVKENSAFDINRFSLIELQKFLNELRDKAWEDLNKKLDSEYFSKLKADLAIVFDKEKVTAALSESIGEKAASLDELEEKISGYSIEKKKEAYNILLEQYQKFNFVGAEDAELFEQKNEVKQLLITAADEEDKKSLVKYSLYDIKDAIDGNHLVGLKDSLNILAKNKDILPEIDTSILKDINFMPESIEKIFTDQIEGIKGLFNTSVFMDGVGKFGLDDINGDGISETAKGLLDGGKKKVEESAIKAKDTLEGLFNNFNN